MGLRIAYYRKRQELSQEALSEAVGISRSYLSKIERADVKSISLITIMDIAIGLNVKPGDLLRLDEDM